MSTTPLGPGIRVERQGRIATVVFDAADKANALSIDVLRGLLEAARSLETEHDLSAVVLSGARERFTMGFDLRDAARSAGLSLAERRELQALGPRLCAAWEGIEALTIAAVEGWCVGGGVALAVALDVRVAGEGARFYVPEIERGMNMSWGSLPRIVNLVGPARAKQLVLLSEQLGLEEALAWGLVQYRSPRGGALEQALGLAQRAAALPPVQLRMAKAGINAYANALAGATAALDRDQFLLAQASADFAEGVHAFLEKRPAHYRGD